jgi:hypothetical protein
MKGNYMKEVMDKVTTFLGGVTTIMLSFVSLSILAEVIFGTGVFGTEVVANVMELIKALGDGGFVGLIALIILIQVFQKK